MIVTVNGVWHIVSKYNNNKNDDWKENDRRSQSNDYQLSLSTIAAYLVVLSGIVSAWVTLNNSQVQTETKLKAFEQYYEKSFQEFIKHNNEDKHELKRLIIDQQNTSKQVVKQLTRLEHQFESVYSNSRRRGSR